MGQQFSYETGAPSDPAEPRATRAELHLRAKSVIYGLFCVIALLAAAYLVTQYLRVRWGYEYQWGLMPAFDLNGEGNLPVWYQSLIMLLSAGLLAAIGRAQQQASEPFARHWIVLALIFLCLSLDETAQIHEIADVILRVNFGTLHPYLYFGWVLLAVPAAVLLFLWSARFLRYLPRRTAVLFVLAGALYVVGAAGLEMVEGRHVTLYGYREKWGFAVWVAIEETLEMIGVAVFFYALLDYVARRLRELNLGLRIRTD